MADLWNGLNPPYRTIVADPPWRYRSSRILTTAKSRGTRPEVSERYSTMSIDDLCALPVGDLADDDAHLYLWTTNPKLPESFAVMEAWGFEYVTTLTWVKQGTLGLGYYWRGETEHVLFGVRGTLPIPPADRQRNVITAAKQGHSRKPPAFLDAVEKASPAPRVELFARAPRLGWDSWGKGYEGAA